MGGYVFLNSDGKELWRLNLGGAIVWYGYLEEGGGKSLPNALLEEHNWGEVWDATGYRELARRVIRNLAATRQLPPATDAYRISRKASASRFQADALRIFRGSLRKLPRTGRFIAADDLNIDWLEEPCACDVCRATLRPNPRTLQRRNSRSRSP